MSTALAVNSVALRRPARHARDRAVNLCAVRISAAMICRDNHAARLVRYREITGLNSGAKSPTFTIQFPFIHTRYRYIAFWNSKT